MPIWEIAQLPATRSVMVSQWKKVTLTKGAALFEGKGTFACTISIDKQLRHVPILYSKMMCTLAGNKKPEKYLSRQTTLKIEQLNNVNTHIANTACGPAALTKK